MENPFRKICSDIVRRKAFDRFILTCIMLSSGIIGLADYKYQNPVTGALTKESWRNDLISKTELPFLLIFTMEMLLKMVALGLFFEGKYTYFRNPWNYLDFTVVVSGLLEVSIM